MTILLSLDKFGARCRLGALGRKTSETRPIFRACIFCLVKRKKHLICKFSVKLVNNEKATVNSKYYRKAVQLQYSDDENIITDYSWIVNYFINCRQ